MNKFVLILLFPMFFIISCSGIREIVKKDNLGRIVTISHFDDNDLRHVEMIEYYGNSHNPKSILYRKKKDLKLVPYKEKRYQFTNNNLTKLSFYIYKNSQNKITGMIKYYYIRKNPKRIEYYSYIQSLNKMLIFGLDQYTYVNGDRHMRRIIEYEFNKKIKKSMQIRHYVVMYGNGKIISMKLRKMNKESKKIIEKNIKKINLIIDIIEKIENNYNYRARGKEFIEQ